VSGDAKASLECKVVRADGVVTKSVGITVKEAISDPVFTLDAPSAWDGRSAITVTPRIERGATGALRVKWTVGDIAVAHAEIAAKDADAGALRLTRTEKDGTVTVTASIDNGGAPVSRSVTIAVKSPATDPWVHRTPRADETPEQGQFYARDDRDEATLFWNGTLDAPADGVFLRVFADGKPFAESRAKPDADRRYALSAKLKPGLVRYSAEFGTTRAGQDTAVRTVDNLVCGDAFVIDGQSNAVATDWGQGDFPFLAVQLAPWDKGRKRTLAEITAKPLESNWAELREAQNHVAKTLQKVGVAVITDVGDKDDIHPNKKQPVGARLALLAETVAYGKSVESSGPTYASTGRIGSTLVLNLNHAKGLKTSDGSAPTGFAIAGEDRVWHWATAEVHGETVRVSSPDVAKPVAVRYGWSDFPVLNLVNASGLPASPFRTDDFPPITRK
jgi:hypothetical protein